jgi:hypothetical protein
MLIVMTAERIRKGIQRLLSAPRDLRLCGAPIWGPKGKTDGSPEHRALFVEYEKELSTIGRMALDWWDETIEARKRGSNEPDAAIRQAWMDRPAGPASYPGFVALIRDYWLGCDRLNKELPEAQRIPPEFFLLSWLLDGRHEDEVNVLACMPYWPIGLDQDGNWV